MSLELAAARLLIRLQVACPNARVYAVVEPRGGEACTRMAEALASAVSSSSGRVRRLDPAQGGDEVSGAGDLEAGAARRALLSADGVTVVPVRSLLDSPRAVMWAAAADAAVLVARRGETQRADVDEARRVLDAAGAKLVAAVLVE